MSGEIQGVPAIDLGPGTYAIEPAEWRRDAGQQLGNLTSGGGENGEPLWHIHDVERADGTRVLEVLEDRREMEGTFGTSGRQFLLRSPDGDPRMAYEREGAMVGTTSTLRDLGTEEVLASWGASGLLGRLRRSSWELTDPGGTRRASAKREWSLGALLYR